MCLMCMFVAYKTNNTMKKLLQQLFLTSCTISAVFAQTPNVNKFTQIQANILAMPKEGTIVPTADGGYFMAKDLTVTKYDSTNTVKWSQSLSGTVRIGYVHTITSVCDDGQGGAIITGNFNGTLSTSSDSIVPFYTVSGNGFYTADAFIARINQTGKVWWHRFGEYDGTAPGTDKGVAVKVANNKVYWLAHGTGRNLRFNGVDYPLNQYPGNVGLLCQFGMDGTIDWVSVTKGGGSIPANLVTSGTSIFYTGYSLGSSTDLDFGNTKKIDHNQASFFAVKYDNTGAAQWAVTYDDDNSIANLFGLTADDDGNIYTCGGGSNFTTSYGIRKASGYLVKINGTDGSHAWTKIYTGTALKGPAFSNGKVYVGGNTIDTRYLLTSATDSIEIKLSTPLTGSEQFIAAFEKTGTISGSLKAVGGQAGGTMDHLHSTTNRVIVVGIYSNSNVFGNATIPSTGGNVGAYHIGFFNVVTGTGPSGINNTTAQKLNAVYPNPAHHFIMVETADNTPITNINVIDITGKKVATTNTINNQIAEVNTSTLAKGIYMVEVITVKGVAFSKFIVE